MVPNFSNFELTAMINEGFMISGLILIIVHKHTYNFCGFSLLVYFVVNSCAIVHQIDIELLDLDDVCLLHIKMGIS